jgi:hypothetical protein
MYVIAAYYFGNNYFCDEELHRNWRGGGKKGMLRVPYFAFEEFEEFERFEVPCSMFRVPVALSLDIVC